MLRAPAGPRNNDPAGNSQFGYTASTNNRAIRAISSSQQRFPCEKFVMVVKWSAGIGKQRRLLVGGNPKVFYDAGAS